MTKFFNKLKKNPVFGPFSVHFPNFDDNKMFSPQNSERQTEGWTDPIL